MEVFHYGGESVSVGFEEVSSSDWARQVYKPDIKDKWDALYKKPGYEMRMATISALERQETT